MTPVLNVDALLFSRGKGGGWFPTHILELSQGFEQVCFYQRPIQLFPCHLPLSRKTHLVLSFNVRYQVNDEMSSYLILLPFFSTVRREEMQWKFQSAAHYIASIVLIYASFTNPSPVVSTRPASGLASAARCVASANYILSSATCTFAIAPSRSASGVPSTAH